MDGRKKKPEQQSLDFAAAEGIFRERLSTLGNLAKVVGANCIQANVLRFVFEEGGTHRPVELNLDRIAGIPWIQASENTVRKALQFWERAGIIGIERDRREGGFQAPNAARLLWSSVLQRLLGEGRSIAPSSAVSAGQSESPVDLSDRRFDGHSSQPPASNFDRLEPASNLTASNFDRLIPAYENCRLDGFLRNPIRVLACARGLLSLSSVLSVVDDVSKDRRAEFSAVWSLVDETRRHFYPVNWPRDPAVKEAFTQGAVLACMLFSPRWIETATRAAKSKSGVTPWRYWLGCLRNGLFEVEGLERFATREDAASYFATLMNAVAPAADEVLAECDQPEFVAVGAPAIAESSPEGAELRESVNARRDRRAAREAAIVSKQNQALEDLARIHHNEGP